DLAPIVYHHHEWFDGRGYPDGKAGAEIPRESRIIALCDAVDSITSDDSYRTPLGLDAALAELERCSGSQFDPELVAAFVELARKEALYAAVLERGLRPLIDVLEDLAGHEHERSALDATLGRAMEHLARRPNVARLIYHEALTGAAHLVPLTRAWIQPILAHA